MEKIFEIAITGGPCAAKTTVMAVIPQLLRDLGVTVLTSSEVATEFIESGIVIKQIGLLNFQKKLLQHMLAKEACWREAAGLMPGDMKVILHDRGTADIAAYISPEEFKLVAQEAGQSLVSLRDERYEGVIFLRSVATDKPEVYTRVNNAARSESLEEARALDEKTLAAWIGHPHLRVIDNSTDLDGKVRRVFEVICSIIGIPIPLEIERKYLVHNVDLSLLPKSAQAVHIVQYYLDNPHGASERIRMREQEGTTLYYHTIKKPVSAITRTEIERQISKEEFFELLKRAHSWLEPIKKTRYCFVFRNQYFELDVFTHPDKDLVLLEIELTSEGESVFLPDFLADAKDVTGDPHYANSEIARRG